MSTDPFSRHTTRLWRLLNYSSTGLLLRYSGGYRLGSRSPVYFTSLASILLTPRCDRKSALRVPFLNKWADGIKNSRNLPIPSYLLPRSPELLEPIPGLGQVCPELPSPTYHWSYPLAVYPGLSTAVIPLEQGTI